MIIIEGLKNSIVEFSFNLNDELNRIQTTTKMSMLLNIV